MKKLDYSQIVQPGHIVKASQSFNRGKVHVNEGDLGIVSFRWDDYSDRRNPVCKFDVWTYGHILADQTLTNWIKSEPLNNPQPGDTVYKRVNSNSLCNKRANTSINSICRNRTNKFTSVGTKGIVTDRFRPRDDQWGEYTIEVVTDKGFVLPVESSGDWAVLSKPKSLNYFRPRKDIKA